MIGKKTVLILGAGASVDLGYPTGIELIKEMHSLTADFTQKDNNYAAQRIEETFRGFYQKFPSVQSLNIDTYLRNNPNLATDGKTLIAYALLKREQPIKAFMESLSKVDQPTSWLAYLFHAVTRGCKDKDDLIASIGKLKIITFNYDVSVEAFFLQHFLEQEIYRPHTQELMKNLEIIHVFEKLYALKDEQHDVFSIFEYAKHRRYLEKPPDRQNHVAFANHETLSRAMNFGKNIHVVGERKHEELAESPHLKTARVYLRDAEAIYSIGFSFDPDNLRLLQGADMAWDTKYISYTNLEKSEQLRLAAINFFNATPRELDCTAYQAAANRIAW